MQYFIDVSILYPCKFMMKPEEDVGYLSLLFSALIPWDSLSPSWWGKLIRKIQASMCFHLLMLSNSLMQPCPPFSVSIVGLNSGSLVCTANSLTHQSLSPAWWSSYMSVLDCSDGTVRKALCYVFTLLFGAVWLWTAMSCKEESSHRTSVRWKCEQLHCSV